MEITTGCPSNCKYIHGNKCIATECKRETSTTYIVHKCNEEYFSIPKSQKETRSAMSAEKEEEEWQPIKTC